jgi:hypothetical protein
MIVKWLSLQFGVCAELDSLTGRVVSVQRQRSCCRLRLRDRPAAFLSTRSYDQGGHAGM